MTLPPLLHIEVTRRMPLMQLPVRTTVVPLSNARILYSPASTLTAEQLRSVGEITDIVVPNLFHTEGARAAVATHPAARLWGPPRVDIKEAGLPWKILGADIWPFEQELLHLPLEGMPRVEESTFLHRDSSTLLVADLAFNVVDARGFGPWLILSVFGTHKRFGVSRLFLKMVRDREAFEASIVRLCAHEFQTLVPTHGSIVDGGAKARLMDALKERGIALASRDRQG